MSHREPPSSVHWNIEKGRCRWCGEAVLNSKQQPTARRWHEACVAAFKLIHWPAETRLAVFRRDNGICAGCGADCKEPLFDEAGLQRLRYSADVIWRRKCAASGNRWQHDHIRPLIEANGDPSYWQLDNIQTLCRACHGRKSGAERKRLNAARKRAGILELALA